MQRPFRSRHSSCRRTPYLVQLLPAAALVATCGVLAHATATAPAPQPASADAHADRYVPGADRLAAMTKAGACWGNDGHTHPYPSRVWVVAPYGGSGDVKYVLRGQAAVDAILTSGDYGRAVRFCE
ncbi:hypothetical protein [Nocardioides sp. YIM 152315]|uniref:hypothetical protein n=1 Tax=Nocardioides sp. YIM 152315 TaxID=3031760 RepID=UPI0023DB94FC|nr:hypothetical protein [Nocardioides sp. YIM 152315]